MTGELRHPVPSLIGERAPSAFDVVGGSDDGSPEIAPIRGVADEACGVVTSIPGSAAVLAAAVGADIPRAPADRSVIRP